LPIAANIPGLPTDPRSTRFLLLAQMAGLAVTGWLVWDHSVGPRLALQSFSSIAARASFYVLLGWALSAMITFLIYLVVVDEEPANLIPVSLRASAAGAWFAPAIILLSTLSPVGFFGSLIIIVNTSRILILNWMPAQPISAPPEARWNPWPAIGAALVFQAGVVALMWKYPFPGAALFALSSAIVTALAVTRSGSKPERPSPMPPSTFSVALTIILAAAFSTASLKFSEYASGSGGPSDAGTSAASADTATELDEPDASTYAVGSGGFPGVILMPVKKPKSTALVVPRLNLLKEGEPMTRPLSIPFTGEYWMYQPPFTRPPLRSIRRRGTPLEMSFHTNNGSSMSMEARQKLANPIELRCCGSFEIEVAFRYAVGELRLGVTLIDSQARKRVELGTAPVGPEMTQTLRYKIPPGSESRKVDEIRILYNRPRSDMSRSTNLAVERFVLVPRGQ
jgi:hypothetical protein